MKKGWGKYASKERLIKKGYFRKHSYGSTSREAYEASRRDRLQQSRQSQEEEKVAELAGNSGQQELLSDTEELEKQVIEVIHESSREENALEAYQQGQQGIPFSVEGRSAVEEEDIGKTKEKEMKKMSKKEKTHEARERHEAKESKAYERKEEKKSRKLKKK